MIALLLASQALALDTASLRSDSTFNLFRDPYDFMLQPGVMAAEDERAIITLLSAYGGAGRYVGGYYGQLGPGVLGAAVDFGRASSVSQTETIDHVAIDSDADTKTTTTSLALSSSSDWSGFLSYGLPVSDSLAFGVALYMNQAADKISFDASSGSVGGANTDIDIAGPDEETSIDTESSGQARYKDQTMAVLVGGAMFGDKGYLSLDAGLRTQTLSAVLEDARWHYGDYTTTWSGYVPGTSFGDNRKGLGPIARLELVRQLNDTLGLRLTADLAMASGGPTTNKSTNVYEDQTEDFENTTTTTDELKNAKWNSSSYGALLALHINGEGLAVRPGIRFRATGYGETYTPVSTSVYQYNIAGEEQDPVESTSEFDADLSLKSMSLGLPIAVEVPLGQDEAWTLRMAGDWAWTKSALTVHTHSEVEGDEEIDGDQSSSDDTNASGSVTSTATAAFGLRFWPIDAFRLDAAAFGGTSFTGGGSEAVDIASVWLSATFLLP